MTEIIDPQERVFKLLEAAATHNGHEVRRIDTHISSVFLAGEHAYKIKRAVRFPFLDFRTLEKRKAACEAELKVNKAFAPELYLRVLPITQEAPGSLAINGSGNAIEWAVEMRRFDESRTLDHLADSGEIDGSLANRLGQTVATAHEVAPIVPAEPWIDALRSFEEQNDEELREASELFPPEETATLHAACRAALERLRPLLVVRGRLGLIRRGHGDLHLGNIVMLGDRPVLFDAIEFDPIVAAGDVLYDLAFLLMDLVARRQHQNANIVLNRYLEATGRVEDLDGLAALPLFLSLRAAIRAKVTAARCGLAEAPVRPAIAQSARSYFDLSRRLMKPDPPLLVAIGGLSGTGKSALAKLLAPELAPIPGAIVLRSDIERKALFGRNESERLPPEAYLAEVSARIYAALQHKTARSIAAGHSAIVDAVFARPAERKALADVARKHGIHFKGIFLVASLDTRLARVGMRGVDASDADARIVQAQESYGLGSIEWKLIDTSGTPEETLRRSKAAIAEAVSK